MIEVRDAIPPLDLHPQRISLKRSDLIINAFADSSGGRVPVGKSGRRPSQRSRSAVVVVGQDELERYFIFSAWLKHCTTDELIDQIFETDDLWQPKVFGVDATGTQTLFVDALHRECREKNRRDHYQDFIFEGDKDFRIETTLQPLQAAGKLFVNEEGMGEFKLEFDAFPGSSLKDGLDAVVGCIKLFPRRVRPEEAQREMTGYRDYLRRQNVDSHEALRRAARAFEEANERREANRNRGGRPRNW